MIIVEWWQLGVIGLAVFLAVLIADQISSRLDRAREIVAELAYEAAHGPFPCNKHMGTEPDGVEWWCARQYGHVGQHATPWGIREDELNEWPEDAEIDDVLAAAARNALADVGSVPFTETQETTFESIPGPVDLFPAPSDETQCDSRTLGGQGARCVYAEGHSGSHYFPLSVPLPEQCPARNGCDIPCVLDAEHSTDHHYLP